MTSLWYYKQYNNLIDKCIKLRENGYSDTEVLEEHHILPKCMGGTDNPNNLIKMPVRYHIFAHLFLMKAYPDNHKLSYAAKRMLSTNTNQGRHSVLKTLPIRLISLIRAEAIKNLKNKNPFKGRTHTKESREKMSLSHKNKYPTIETKEKQSKAKLGSKNPFYGKKHSEETKQRISAKMSGKNNPNYKKKLDDSWKQKISTSKLGKKRNPFSEEWRKNMSKSKEGGKNNRARKIQDPTGKVFDTVKSAAEYYHICTDTVRDWCRNKPEKGFKYL